MSVISSKVQQEALMREYRNGMTAGMALTLRLLLGEEIYEGIIACPQPIPDGIKKWAEDALTKMRNDGVPEATRGVQ